jgi:UrcA family protein
MVKTVLSAMLPIALLSAPVLAAPADTGPSVIVHYDDLNLATNSGAATLDRRISNAARQVCGEPDGRDLVQYQAHVACRTTALNAAHAQVEVMLASARAHNTVALNMVELPRHQ